MSQQPEIVVAAMVGSLRRASINHGLLRAAQDVAPAGMRIVALPIGDLPLFNDDLDHDGGPAPVRAMRETIATADAVLIVTPEYNYSVPGLLKNAIDWASRPSGRSVLNGKPGAILGAAGGRSGTMRAQPHLRMILSALNVQVLTKPELYVTFAGDKFDADGILTDEVVRDEVRALLNAFQHWIARISG